jgi:hypothetical protein
VWSLGLIHYQGLTPDNLKRQTFLIIIFFRI